MEILLEVKMVLIHVITMMKIVSKVIDVILMFVYNVIHHALDVMSISLNLMPKIFVQNVIH